jgi:transcriptional regulator with XRE-family HTH domain
MSSFAERLRSEIDYAGLSQKELAAKAGIKKRALDMYLGAQKSIPRADIAVKIASALGVSVEYLITGKEVLRSKETGKEAPRSGEVPSSEISRYFKIRDIFDDLLLLPDETLLPIKSMIKTFAKQERKKAAKND